MQIEEYRFRDARGAPLEAIERVLEVALGESLREGVQRIAQQRHLQAGSQLAYMFLSPRFCDTELSKRPCHVRSWQLIQAEGLHWLLTLLT